MIPVAAPVVSITHGKPRASGDDPLAAVRPYTLLM